jgi:hypothetical protein
MWLLEAEVVPLHPENGIRPRMNTDKEELASTKPLTETVSAFERFLIRVYRCSSVVKSL